MTIFVTMIVKFNIIVMLLLVYCY